MEIKTQSKKEDLWIFQKFNNKIHYESGEFIIANYMVGKLLAFPDEQEIIDLTGSLEEQDDW